ncbi:MAG TPA: radical SAM family heme chaperone HemW [Bacteroidota bacterium]|nr:radical SAM family heme chaperone HemW [Bacteroidota bacterium]
MASLYLHIPFCEKKCLYCDFYSIENLSRTEDFLAALHHEIDLYARYAEKESVETVFFGGGTPSLLSPGQLGDILSHLRRVFSVEGDAEITVETNPGTVTAEKLAAFRSLGVNRLSIGVQSFHDDELKFLSRIHDAAEAIRCIEYARCAGFDNVGIDLIYALPGQTLQRWQATLRRAVELQPDHISAYGLIVEDGTPLARMVHAGLLSPMPADEEAEFYEFTMAFLEAHGFEHYEVSNYARPGFRSRHNYNYWRHANYLGFGPSAHSFWKEGNRVAWRWWNISNLSHYCSSLKGGMLPILQEETLDTVHLLEEEIFLGLRSDGVRLERLRHDASQTRSLVASLIDEGAAMIENGILRLTRKGYLLCDEIAARLMP